MGQIVKRKKKGRPSKADLARRGSSQTPTRSTPPERRRSLRRRNVRFNNFIDYDDYLDEFEDFEDIIEQDEDDDKQEERRKEKKLKLVLKLHNEEKNNHKNRLKTGRVQSDDATSSEEEDDEGERKPLKKRKINGGEDSDDQEEVDVDDDESENEENDHEERSDRETKADVKGQEVASGTPSDRGNVTPLPDKKLLEMILSELQKRDTYGVYAEPVDLEELPDYLDVIDHPMDFATVRKKLGNGSYSTFEQFESDVFLICSNAMQYNGPETIYYKQARAIQEQARKKFYKLRIDMERIEKEFNSDQKTKPNSWPKKPMKKPVNRTLQEPIGSDFSSGATLVAAGELQNGSVAVHGGGSERPGISEARVEGNSSAVDGIMERAEDLSSGKGLLSKFGRKLTVPDENRRATYNKSDQQMVKSESIFTTFEDEIKQLVAVGLHAEYSYARSLARFAANLGPVAWKVASKRIEQALPPGCKFGRGWVGEYEPPPTPVVLLDTHMQDESALFPKSQTPADPLKDDEASLRTQISAKEQQPIREPAFEGNSSMFHPSSGPVSDGKLPLSISRTSNSPKNLSNLQQNVPFKSSTKTTCQQQKPPAKNSAEAQNEGLKRVELNLPPSSYQQDTDIAAEKKVHYESDMAAPKTIKKARKVVVMQSLPPKKMDNNIVGFGGLPNGKVSNNILNCRTNNPSSDRTPNHMNQGGTSFPQDQEKVLTDPVEAMKISAEKSLNEEKLLNKSSGDTFPVMSSAPPARNDSGNAAIAAARAWMSFGAGGFRPPMENVALSKGQISAESLYNPARQIHAQIPPVHSQFPHSVGLQMRPQMNNFPFQALVRPVQTGSDGHVQNLPMVFPQLVTTGLSRFQMQSPWQAMSVCSQRKQKQEMLPPDLNIGCQSPGSPVKQSSGDIVDSQQPDLALQL